MSGRIQDGAKLFGRVDGRKLNGAKITHLVITGMSNLIPGSITSSPKTKDLAQYFFLSKGQEV